MNAIKRVCLMSSLAATVMASFSAFAQAVAEGTAKAAATVKTESVQKETDGKEYKPLAEARAKIGDILSDPSMMTEVLKDLSPEDQKTFVADVNAAISKLPGSTEDKTAKFLNINRAALKGASQGNMANLLAVTFATVPPESLAVISEQYAKDLFNRDADPSQRVNNAAYEKTALEVVGKVEKETTGSDDAGVRNTLAILMFLRASNDVTEEFTNKLVDTIPDSNVQMLAKKEWIPAAMNGEGASYDSMLAYADAGKAPDLNIVLSLAGPQILESMLIDLTSGMDVNHYQTTPVLDQAFGGFDEAAMAVRVDTTSATATTQAGGGEVPRSGAPVPWNPEYKRSDMTGDVPTPEPYPYSAM